MFGRKPKTQETKTQTENPIFGPIGDPDAEPEAGAEAGEEFLKGYKTREDAEAALAKLAESDAQLKAMRESQETLQQIVDRLASGNSAPPGEDAKPLEIDLSKLPDPVEDKDGFVKAVFENVDRVVQHRTSQAAQPTSEQRLAPVWAKFREKYEDLAFDQDLVEISARDVIEEAKASGLNPERFVFGNTSRFLEKLAKRTQERLDGYKERLGVETTDENDPPVNRTAGVSSGSGAPTNTQGKEQAKLGSLVGDIKALQRASGLF